MITDAVNPNQLVADLLVEELVRLGVRAFFLAPGSRSAPLAVAASRHPEADCFVHFDERGSAFAAVGYGRAGPSPAAWITTSGTAAANGLPAIVEASVDGVPLIALTADRPPELRRTGANQTIDQSDIFGGYVRWRFDLPPWGNDVDPDFVLTALDQAVHRSVADLGPVHLNCMFREPLAPARAEGFAFSPGSSVARWLKGSDPFTRYLAPATGVAADVIEMLADVCRQTDDGLVVAGRLRSEEEGAAVIAVARRLGWPLLPDVLSFARQSGYEGEVGGFDVLLSSSAFRDRFQPHTVLHFGARATSKRLYQHLEDTPPKHLVLISPVRDRVDPAHGVTHRVEADVAEICDALIDRIPSVPRDGESPKVFDSRRYLQEAVQGELDDWIVGRERASEPHAARHISEQLPRDHVLFVGSSMPIRDMDSFARPVRRLRAFGNRGASGIDGTLASASGLAAGRRSPVTVLLGDLALLHDLNSLALVQSSKYPIVVVVINNRGGGIFSFLPIAEYPDVFEKVFGTPHDFDFRGAAAMFGLPYFVAEDQSELAEAYKALCESAVSGLVEVRTDREENRVLHEEIVEAVCEKVAEVLVSQPSIPDRV